MLMSRRTLRTLEYDCIDSPLAFTPLRAELYKQIGLFMVLQVMVSHQAYNAYANRLTEQIVFLVHFTSSPCLSDLTGRGELLSN